jgi:hypothetical protein
LNGCGDNGKRKMWSSCNCIYCSHLASHDIRTLSVSILEATARTSKFVLRIIHWAVVTVTINCEVLYHCFLWFPTPYFVMYEFCKCSAHAAVEEYWGILLTAGFCLGVYFHMFTRQCVKLVVFQVSVCSWKGKWFFKLIYERTCLRCIGSIYYHQHNKQLVVMVFTTICFNSYESSSGYVQNLWF